MKKQIKLLIELAKTLYALVLSKISLKKYATYKLKQAIKKAQIGWIKTGKRHYVIPNNEDFFIIDSTTRRKLKKKNGKKYSEIEILDMAAYFTPVGTYHNIKY